MLMEGGGENVRNKKSNDIMELVENDKLYTKYVHHKFTELDRDCDGKLSVQELQPAVADIGAALGLPAQGTSPDSDHIYSEVLSGFTHDKNHKVSTRQFKEVLTDNLVAMAAGLKRDPIVILRIDGDDLREFIHGPSFEEVMVSIFSELDIVPEAGTLNDYIIKAFGKLTVDQGMPPASDSWVKSNVILPVLQSYGTGVGEEPVSQETFLVEFKKVAENVAQHLKELPVIVAHSENKFDGSGIRRLFSNKFEFDKILDAAMKGLPKDRNGKVNKEYLRVALDVVAPSAGLPPFAAVDEMDKVIGDACKMLDADDGKTCKEDEFKKILTELLGSVMLQLEGNPIAVTTNSVVH